MKKFLSNTIVQLLIAVIIGLLAGFVVNDAVLEVVICIKHITGQIIFFLVPLIILGFIAPSIAHLRSNACLLYTSPSPRDRQKSRMPSSA